MTTIIYNHKTKEIGMDSRTSDGTFILSDNSVKATVASNGDILFISGRVDHEQHIINKWPDIDAIKDCDNDVFVVTNGEAYSIYPNAENPFLAKLTYNDAIGSGWVSGLNALDYGESTLNALIYATKKDVNTGGTLRVFDVENMRFKLEEPEGWNNGK